MAKTLRFTPCKCGLYPQVFMYRDGKRLYAKCPRKSCNTLIPNYYDPRIITTIHDIVETWNSFKFHAWKK